MNESIKAIKEIMKAEKIVDSFDFMVWLDNSRGEQQKDARIHKICDALIQAVETLDRIVNIAKLK